MNKVRIATTNDGRRYLVQQLDFKYERAHCWGEVLAVRGGKTSHDASVALDLAAVTITEVERSAGLLRALFNQGADVRRKHREAAEKVAGEFDAACAAEMQDPVSRKVFDGVRAVAGGEAAVRAARKAIALANVVGYAMNGGRKRDPFIVEAAKRISASLAAVVVEASPDQGAETMLGPEGT